MILSYNTDDPLQLDTLIAQRKSVFREVRERNYSRRPYAGSAMDHIGVKPIEAVQDVLIQPSDYADAIKYAHDNMIMPMYHQKATWGPDGFVSNQDGIGYCWTWSGTATFMDLRASEDKDTVILSPVSMGYLVGWADRGNYLESFIKGAREQGIYPGEFNSHARQASKWPMDATRKRYRLDEIWDTDPSTDDRMVQHMISGLCHGRGMFMAYNWWGHALEIVGVLWTPGQYKNITVVIRNSHGESDFIQLTGTRCIPDEGYFFVSSKPEEMT